ncbi:MAG TPA: ketosynthase chain-length factor [Jatrophihabitans sp.]|nr:ketosynthase chain-length factor [Jatrophihabitans sp.]
MHAVITGIGVVAPNGLGIDDYWANTVAGKGGIGRITRFDPSGYPAQLAGEVPGFVAEDCLESRLLPQTDHMTRLALVAADWAMADAGIGPADFDEYEVGAITASSAGGFEFGQNELRALWSRGSQFVSAYQSFAWFYAVNTGQISIRHGLRGPSGVVVADQAGGLDAIAQARRQLRHGRRAMVTGGVDASICPWGWAALLTSGGISTASDPADAYRPFDPASTGYVPGEGGALLILEEAESAAARRRPRYGTVAGYGASFDPHPSTGRPPALRRAIESALADAAVDAGDVDVVFADGWGLPGPDAVEAAALCAVFGPAGVPVTVPKSMTGRLNSGAGALDVVTALLAIRDDLIPPTINVAGAAEYQLDLVVGQARPARLGTALIIARGYRGFNSALVVTG